jgi:hypothetical protein
MLAREYYPTLVLSWIVRTFGWLGNFKQPVYRRTVHHLQNSTRAVNLYLLHGNFIA